jgi:hypothetical protein
MDPPADQRKPQLTALNAKAAHTATVNALTSQALDKTRPKGNEDTAENVVRCRNMRAL